MKISVVGIGSGNIEDMTPRAAAALRQCDVIVGYSRYIELIGELSKDKEVYISGMRHEAERCKKALEYALLGKIVCVISSGDAGIYGMASLIFETCAGSGIEIEVIPGITAASSAAALLGAPLTNDFAVISLSNLLTPWEVIIKRIEAAAAGDFVICIYNPSSSQRKENLKIVCEYILKYRPSETPCGIVRNAGRDGESVRLCRLGELLSFHADMLTTIIIGNSSSFVIDGKLVTSRGYNKI